MKAGIIGTGFAAEVHMKALRACNVSVDVVMSQREEHAKAFAKKWGIPKWVTSVEAIMESEADVIHICTPPTTHGTLVKSALDAGKHVLCEKPLSLSQTEAKDLAEQAAMSGKICGMVLNVRYHMACQRAKELVENGMIGRPILIHGTYLQEFGALPAPYDWRYHPETGGEMRAVSEIGTHWFDIAEYISGQRIKEVSALFACYTPHRILKDGMMYPDKASEKANETGRKVQASASLDGDKIEVTSEDAAIIQMKFENQALGSVVLSEVSPGRGNHLSLEITGTDGNIWWNEEENNQLFTARKGEGIRKEVFAFGNGFSETFIQMFEAFYQAVQEGRPGETYPDFARGARIARICQGVLESVRTGGAWINVE